MSGELENRVAVVTGAARNIGRAIALELARAGACVVVNALGSADAAAEVVGRIESEGGRAIVHLADVTSPVATEGLMAAAVAAFGGIDILVNNAAIRRERPLAEIDLAAWHEVTSVVLDGAYICSRAAEPWLRRSEAGSIVNIGGMSAHSGSAARAHVMAAKSGLIGLTRALAMDLADSGITANTVVPGLIDTVRGHSAGGEPEHHARARNPLGRRGRPEEIAYAVRFLVGPGARFITGQSIHVNGGAFLA
jgi:3-oxoacyl-[acyl-carrier protein] reductase